MYSQERGSNPDMLSASQAIANSKCLPCPLQRVAEQLNQDPRGWTHDLLLISPPAEGPKFLPLISSQGMAQWRSTQATAMVQLGKRVRSLQVATRLGANLVPPHTPRLDPWGLPEKFLSLVGSTRQTPPGSFPPLLDLSFTRP